MSSNLEKLKGQINVNLKNAIRKSDKKQLLILDTTVRGYTSSSDLEMDEWFRLAKNEIVDSFINITTDDTTTFAYKIC